MNKSALSILAFLVLAIPAYADANLTVNGTDIAPAYINSNQTNLIISLNISIAGALGNNTRVNITSNASFNFSALSGINVTVELRNRASNLSTIVDVHASTSVTPRYVDTFAFNQTMIYTVNITGRDSIGNITIVIPTEYTNVSIAQIKRDGSVVTTDFTSSNVSSRINISFITAAATSIIINFTVNSSAATSNLSFNATLKDWRLNATPQNNNTGVQALSILTINNVVGSKLTALPNGTDYWEFNFTFNFSANITGGLLFRMQDWMDNASQTINVNTSNSSYAVARLDADGTKSLNVTNVYNVSRYMQMSLDSTSQQRLALKMILPVGTPVSSTWWTNYFMLFRVDP